MTDLLDTVPHTRLICFSDLKDQLILGQNGSRIGADCPMSLSRRFVLLCAFRPSRAQQDECHSHGLYRLIGCVHSITSGRINKEANPVVSDIAPGIVRVDADHGFSPLAYGRGINLAISKARSQGLSALAINNCYHFSALWPEVEPLAEQGLAALALTPSHNWVALSGGKSPVFGTNPLAFAWPRPGKQPFVFDFATSATARGEIELHRREGTPIDPGLAIDRLGYPTTDPAEALSGTDAWRTHCPF